MALTYVASLPLYLLAPSVWLSVGVPSVSLSASLQGNLALNASLSASPPTVAAQIGASVEFTAQVAAAAAFVPPVPSFSFSISDTVSLNASLGAALNVYLPALNVLLSASAGIYAFAYEGVGTGLGPSVTTELVAQWPDGAPTTGNTTALIFGAVSASARTNIPLFLNGMTFGPGLVYTGKIGMSAMCPVVVGAASQGGASLGAQIKASAHLSAAASIAPPSFVAMLEAQARFTANLAALGKIAPPQFALNATANAAASISANFGASCSLGAVLGQFGSTFFVYEYTGPANGLGAALSAALASTWGDDLTPSSSVCTAVVLGATDALSIATMLGFFGGA